MNILEFAIAHMHTNYPIYKLKSYDHGKSI